MAATAHPAAPNSGDLDTAIKAGDFGGYFASLTSWLSQQVADKGSDISEASAKSLLADSVFVKNLDQRQLIFKTGADKLGAFAKADPANQEFLTWLLNNTQAMDLYLEAVVPIGLAAREQNSYTLQRRLKIGFQRRHRLLDLMSDCHDCGRPVGLLG